MQHLSASSRTARRAAVAVQVALTMTVLLGMLAIVVDGGLLLAQRRQQQAAADAAALAYATIMANGGTTDTAQTVALATAAANGAANDGTYSLITPNTTSGGTPLHGIWNGPYSGTFVGVAGTGNYATGYVQVVVQYNENRRFSAIWGSGTLPVRAQAVAGWTAGSQSYLSESIVALATGQIDLSSGGSASISVPGSIVVNGDLKTNDGGSITSTGGVINYAGTLSGSGYSPTPTKMAAITDPLASLTAPIPSDANGGKIQSSSALTIKGTTQNLSPGVYQGGISISNGAQVTLSAGIYYIEGGGLSIQDSSTTVTGNGVLIVNGETNGNGGASTVGSINVQNGTLNLTPISSGTWQGISIYQDPSVTASMTLGQVGGSSNIGGLVYAPAATVSVGGNGSMTGTTSFIVSSLSLLGNATFTTPTVQVPIPGSQTNASVQLVQ